LSERQKTILQNYVDGISNGESARREQVKALENLNVLAVGDSLFDGDFLSGDRQWIGLLAKECSWNLTNLGQDGWTVSYNPTVYEDGVQVRPAMVDHLLNNANYKYGSTSYYSQTNHEPVTDTVDLILLEGGINDYNWGMPLGDITSSDIGTLYGAFHTMIDTLYEAHPDAKIVLVTTWHRDGTRADGAEAMDFVANALKNIKSTNYANDDRVILIDAGDPAVSGIDMSDAEFRAAYAKSVDDSAHLNEAGMERMATSMLALLAEVVGNAANEA
jgi:lysophospholipase L1-like esterase